MAVEPGDLVTYLAHPDWGSGLVEWVLNDRVCVSFETPDGPYTDEFAMGELHTEPKKVAA